MTDTDEQAAANSPTPEAKPPRNEETSAEAAGATAGIPARSAAGSRTPQPPPPPKASRRTPATATGEATATAGVPAPPTDNLAETDTEEIATGSRRVQVDFTPVDPGAQTDQIPPRATWLDDEAAPASGRRARSHEAAPGGPESADADESPPPSPTGAPADPERGLIWFVYASGLQLGPFTEAEIRARLVARTLLPRHYAWRLGFGDSWHRLREVAEFRDVIADVAPEALRRDASGAPTRLFCPSCYERIAHDWPTCRACGLALKQSATGERPARPALGALLAVVGALLAAIALCLPWVQAAPISANPGDALALVNLTGVDLGPSGWLVTLAALLAAYTLGNLAAPRQRRVVLPFLLALVGCGLTVFVIADLAAHPEAAVELLAPGAPASASAADVLGLGSFVFGAGLLLIAGSLARPAWRAARMRPAAAGITLVLVAALTAGVAVSRSEAAHAMQIRFYLESHGFTAVSVTPAPSAGNRPWSLGQPVTFAVTAARGDVLYLGRIRLTLGDWWAARQVALAPVPAKERELVAALIQANDRTGAP